MRLLSRISGIRVVELCKGGGNSLVHAAEQIRHCLRAKPDGKKTTESQQRQRADLAQKKIRHARQTLEDHQQLGSKRLGCALRLLHVPEVAERIPNAAKWRRDCQEILPCLRALSDAMDSLMEYSRHYSSAATLFECLSDNNDESLIIPLQAPGDKLVPITKQLHSSWSKLPYPYRRDERQMTLGKFLIPTVPVKGNLGTVFNAADQIVDGAFTLYVRCLGDLIYRAEAVETAVGLAQASPPKNPSARYR